MNDFFESIIYSLGFVALCCIMGLLFALPTMWLLNWLVPALFPGAVVALGWTGIKWFQAWGLNILCNILFKGSGQKKNN